MEEKVKKFIEQFKNATQHLDPTDERLKKLDINFVRSLSHIIETHPGIKSGQLKYITEKALLIACGLDMSVEEKGDMLYAGLLLQLGKINLPYKLLTKPFYSMSTVDKYHYLGHAIDGDLFLEGLRQFEGARVIIRHQYEHYDGRGFPDGLIEHNIPLGSRILSVVSDYIAFLDGSMTGTEMFADAAISQLTIRKNSCYDPDIVYVFINVLKGASAEELKDAIAKEKKIALATERWRKGVLLRTKSNTITQASTVEIALSQMKLGMKVESIFFGCTPYIRHCIVDQTIIDSVTELAKSEGKNPIIKIILSMK
jgi:response regulator RpfG family c-di-GMP phosphodiesterase